MPLPLVLASSSVYKKSVLSKLALPFTTAKPNTDESPLPNEAPSNLVIRLSEEKAKSLAKSHPNSLIIGVDQVATYENEIIGKSGTFEIAFEQLKRFSGQCILFHTGLCLYNSKTERIQVKDIQFKVHFRTLLDSEIIYYLHKEQPYDCAGSFKSEGLGISLFEKLEGDDPNTLIGMPLIELGKMLRQEGFLTLSPQTKND